MDTCFQTLITDLIIQGLRQPKVQEELVSIFSQGPKARQQEHQNNDDAQKLLSIAEVAEMFNVTKATVHNYCRRNLLVKHKVKGSSKTYFKEIEVEAAIRAIRPYQRSP